MNKKFVVWGFALIAVMVILFLAFNNSTPTGSAINSGSEIKEFVIESKTEIIDGKYYPQFSPKEIVVEKGDRVRIKITNIKGTHDFKIDEFDVYAETPLNQQVTVEFTADKAGSFEYYCTKPGHKQAGHLGTLKVLE